MFQPSVRRYDRSDLAACMEAFWRHTDSLIFQSRYQEILLLVQDDPLEDILKVRSFKRLRLTSDAWSMVIRLRQATNEYAPPLLIVLF